MIRETVLSWEKYRNYLLEALEHGHGTHNEDDVLSRIITGEYKLWTFEKCAVVTFFIQYPRFKAVNLFIAGGDLEELKSVQPQIERWAVAQGCSRCVAGGRPGWERIFTDYTKNGCLFFKDL